MLGHKWRDEGRNFVPGALDRLTRIGQGGYGESWDRMLYGVTTVTQRCEKCGRLRSYVVTGDARASDRAAMVPA